MKTKTENTVPELSPEEQIELQKTEELKLIGQELRTKYGRAVYRFAVEDHNGVERAIWLKKPTMEQIEPIGEKMIRAPFTAAKILWESCGIKERSDMVVIEDEDLFMSVAGKFAEMIEVKKSSFQKF